MNIFMFFAMLHNKKTVKKYIEVLKNTSYDVRAEWMFYVWLTRGINLALADDTTFSNVQSMLEKNGFPVLNIPIYAYKKGSEVGIINYKKVCGIRHSHPYFNALNIHLYTSIAATYPNKKNYCNDIKEMWGLLLSNYGDLEEMKLELSGWFKNPPELIKMLIENNNITIEELIERPNTIFPEFLEQE